MAQQRIAIKLAKISVAIAFIVGLLLSALQVYRDFLQEEVALNQIVNRILKVAERSATASVHTLSEELSDEVIIGLLEYDFIQQASIVDDLGTQLAQQKRPQIETSKTRWLTATFADQYQHYSIELYPPSVNTDTPGKLIIVVNVDTALASFYSRSLVVLVSGIVRNIILVLLLFIAFHFIITRPLINLGREFKKINPEDLSSKLQPPPGHEDDEFNFLTQAANNLIDENHQFIHELRDKNTEMAESEARLRTLVETIPDLIWLKDPDGKYLSCNQHFERFFGAKEADVIGKTDYDFVDKDLADFFRAKDQAAMDAQQTTSNEEEVVFADDGHRAILHTLKTPMHNNQGKLIGILGIARDITDRKQTELDLHTATQRYGTLIENVPGITYHCACDEDWTMEFISDEVESITGYPASDFIANKIRTYASIIHPDDVQLVDETVQIAVAKKQPYTIEYRIVSADDEIKWQYEKGRGVFDGNGDLYRLDGVIIDITERKQAETEVGQLRSYLSNIIDSMPSIIIGVDIVGTVTQWNNGAEQAMGLTTNEAVGQPLREVFPRLAVEMPKVQEAINSRQQQSDKKRSYFHDGVHTYEDVIIYPLVANGVEGAVIRVDDVTEQVRLEEMMIQSEKMLSVGGLAAGMAHEINNPLAGMMQTAHVMINRLTNKNVEANQQAAKAAGTSMEAIYDFMEQRGIVRMLNAIRDSGERVAGIVDNMLSFARKSDDVYSTHDINELLDKSIELSSTDYDLKKQYDFKSIVISKEYEDDVPLISCDGGKIQQVLLNLLRNGAQAMHEAGIEQPEFRLHTYYDAEQDKVCIKIKDNGPGMDEEIRKRIFEPFFTTKPIGIGTGLGLSVSYFIITENHGGKMTVESTVGVGTTFMISLPMSVASQ
ncbi:MAG: hypothetical protein COC04_05040 [Gammaproteobacteria bacterium]|nr:MAG: hypothetical protein COC04_05040 [Gammaproteobacteria bacterium]